MKSTPRFAFVVVAILLTAPAAFAADFGVRAGRYNDAEEEFVGVEVAWDSGAVTFNPNIEYALNDDVTLLSGNFDVLFNFGRAAVRPYVGAGLGISYFSADIGFERINETDPLFNLIGGVKFQLGTLQPYAQVKYFRLFEDGEAAGDDLAFTVGLRF